jgi:hypothetical protein
MFLRLKIMEELLKLYQQALALMLRLETIVTPNGEKVYEVAKICLNCPMSPDYKYGCAEAVNNVVNIAIGKPVGGEASTYRMYESLKNKIRFLKTTKPNRGDIIISPTGYGNGRISNGHVGIMLDNGVIASDNTKTGLFDSHLTLSSWENYYKNKGGFPMEFYRVI